MRLLVGYLATKGGADAVAVASMIARTLGASLDIAMIVPRDDLAAAVTPSGGYHELLAAHAQEWLDEAAATIPSDLQVETHVLLRESSAEGLIELAEQLDASAIVVGGAGGGLVGSLSLGAVVNELLHASPVPVVLSPKGARHVKAERVRELTCAIGTRAGAATLFRTATKAAAQAGVPLRLVSLVAVDETRYAEPEDRRKPAIDHAQRVVDEARNALPADVEVTSIVTDGRTVEDAVNKLDWHDGDVILIGSSRLAQPRRLFLGSTAARMLRVLRVPVVVVPKEES